MEKFCVLGSARAVCEAVGRLLASEGKEVCVFVSKRVPELISKAKSEEGTPVLVMKNAALTPAAREFSRSGVHDMYVVPCDMPANNPYTRGTECMLHIDNSKPRLRRLTVEVYAKCNQNCKGCLHFSSLARADDYMSPEEMERDFVRLRDFFWGIEIIDLIGGEPLLNKRVGEYIELAHRIFPDCNVRLLTNGLLIPKTLDRLPSDLNDYNCEISITQYPTTAKMRGAIIDSLDRSSVPYDISKTRYLFFKTLFLRPNKPSKRFAYKYCLLKPCNGLFKGRIAPCAATVFFYRLKAAFPETEPLPDNSVSIYETSMGGWELLDFLENSPNEICAYCYTGWEPIKWKARYSESPKLSDWIIKDDFFHTVILQYAFVAAMPLVKLMFRTMHFIEDRVQNR